MKKFILVLLPVLVNAAPFLLTVKTDNNGTSAPNQFTIPTTGYAYDYSVDCENDGVYEWSHRNGDTNCSYSAPGTYTIAIDGNFPRIYFNGEGDAQKVLRIEQWGDIAWQSMGNAFEGCSNLQVSATAGVPNLSSVADMHCMFRGASSLNFDPSGWDVSGIVNMDFMFQDASSFDGNVSGWDVSSVSTMRYMFDGAASFNRPLNDWNVSRVTAMTAMFADAAAFNQPLNHWDVSSVTRMSFMFSEASAFNGNIEDWNTSSLEDADYLFSRAVTFDQPIGNWDMSHVKTMAGMFEDATRFNRDIGDWNLSGLDAVHYYEALYSVFRNAESFNQDIGNWNINGGGQMYFFLKGAALSVSQYDSLLRRWAANSPHDSISFDAGNSHYCHGQNARTSLIDTHNWHITDNGLDCTFVFTSPDEMNATSGTRCVANLTVNAGPATFTLSGGIDADHFTIDSTTGKLCFVSSPDVRHPADANGDNIYRVQITADDGNGHTDVQTVRIRVIEFNAARIVPVITYLLQ